MNRKPYPEYKDSGVQWLGQVPAHWEVDRCKWSIERVINGIWGSEPDEENDLVCVRVADFDRTAFRVIDEPSTIRAVETGQRGNRLLRKGDLLIEKSGGGEKQLVGCVVHYDLDLKAVCSNFVARMPIASEMNSRFWTYVHAGMYAGRINYPSIKQTTGIQNLDSASYLDERVVYPPLSEQTAIANFLDRETGRIDTLLEKKRRLIALLKEKRTALISRTVTRGLPEAAAREFGLEPHTRFKDSGIEWLGQVPEAWEAQHLRRLIRSVKTGNTPSGAEEYHFEDGGLNWYSPSDFSDALYLGAANRTLSAEGRKEVRIFPDMTVMLVGIGATIGKAGLATNESSCNQQVNAIMCNSRLNPIFATYYLKTMRDFIVKCGKFTTMPIINQDETKNLIFTAPPPSEQTAIATYLDRETDKIDQLVRKVEAAIERLQEYRTALITAAVTGKIDVRDTDTEQAVA